MDSSRFDCCWGTQSLMVYRQYGWLLTGEIRFESWQGAGWARGMCRARALPGHRVGVGERDAGESAIARVNGARGNCYGAPGSPGAATTTQCLDIKCGVTGKAP